MPAKYHYKPAGVVTIGKRGGKIVGWREPGHKPVYQGSADALRMAEATGTKAKSGMDEKTFSEMVHGLYGVKFRPWKGTTKLLSITVPASKVPESQEDVDALVAVMKDRVHASLALVSDGISAKGKPVFKKRSDGSLIVAMQVVASGEIHEHAHAKSKGKSHWMVTQPKKGYESWTHKGQWKKPKWFGEHHHDSWNGFDWFPGEHFVFDHVNGSRYNVAVSDDTTKPLQVNVTVPSGSVFWELKGVSSYSPVMASGTVQPVVLKETRTISFASMDEAMAFVGGWEQGVTGDLYGYGGSHMLPTIEEAETLPHMEKDDGKYGQTLDESSSFTKPSKAHDDHAKIIHVNASAPQPTPELDSEPELDSIPEIQTLPPTPDAFKQTAPAAPVTPVEHKQSDAAIKKLQNGLVNEPKFPLMHDWPHGTVDAKPSGWPDWAPAPGTVQAFIDHEGHTWAIETYAEDVGWLDEGQSPVGVHLHKLSVAEGGDVFGLDMQTAALALWPKLTEFVESAGGWQDVHTEVMKGFLSGLPIVVDADGTTHYDTIPKVVEIPVLGDHGQAANPFDIAKEAAQTPEAMKSNGAAVVEPHEVEAVLKPLKMAGANIAHLQQACAGAPWKWVVDVGDETKVVKLNSWFAKGKYAKPIVSGLPNPSEWDTAGVHCLVNSDGSFTAEFAGKQWHFTPHLAKKHADEGPKLAAQLGWGSAEHIAQKDVEPDIKPPPPPPPAIPTFADTTQAFAYVLKTAGKVKWHIDGPEGKTTAPKKVNAWASKGSYCPAVAKKLAAPHAWLTQKVDVKAGGEVVVHGENGAYTFTPSGAKADVDAALELLGVPAEKPKAAGPSEVVDLESGIYKPMMPTVDGESLHSIVSGLVPGTTLTGSHGSMKKSLLLMPVGTVLSLSTGQTATKTAPHEWALSQTNEPTEQHVHAGEFAGGGPVIIEKMPPVMPAMVAGYTKKWPDVKLKPGQAFVWFTESTSLPVGSVVAGPSGKLYELVEDPDDATAKAWKSGADMFGGGPPNGVLVSMPGVKTPMVDAPKMEVTFELPVKGETVKPSNVVLDALPVGTILEQPGGGTYLKTADDAWWVGELQDSAQNFDVANEADSYIHGGEGDVLGQLAPHMVVEKGKPELYAAMPEGTVLKTVMAGGGMYYKKEGDIWKASKTPDFSKVVVTKKKLTFYAKAISKVIVAATASKPLLQPDDAGHLDNVAAATTHPIGKIDPSKSELEALPVGATIKVVSMASDQVYIYSKSANADTVETDPDGSSWMHSDGLWSFANSETIAKWHTGAPYKVTVESVPTAPVVKTEPAAPPHLTAGATINSKADFDQLPTGSTIDLLNEGQFGYKMIKDASGKWMMMETGAPSTPVPVGTLLYFISHPEAHKLVVSGLPSKPSTAVAGTTVEPGKATLIPPESIGAFISHAPVGTKVQTVEDGNIENWTKVGDNEWTEDSAGYSMEPSGFISHAKGGATSYALHLPEGAAQPTIQWTAETLQAFAPGTVLQGVQEEWGAEPDTFTKLGNGDWLKKGPDGLGEAHLSSAKMLLVDGSTPLVLVKKGEEPVSTEKETTAHVDAENPDAPVADTLKHKAPDISLKWAHTDEPKKGAAWFHGAMDGDKLTIHAEGATYKLSGVMYKAGFKWLPHADKSDKTIPKKWEFTGTKAEALEALDYIHQAVADPLAYHAGLEAAGLSPMMPYKLEQLKKFTAEALTMSPTLAGVLDGTTVEKVDPEVAVPKDVYVPATQAESVQLTMQQADVKWEITSPWDETAKSAIKTWAAKGKLEPKIVKEFGGVTKLPPPSEWGKEGFTVEVDEGVVHVTVPTDDPNLLATWKLKPLCKGAKKKNIHAQLVGFDAELAMMTHGETPIQAAIDNPLPEPMKLITKPAPPPTPGKHKSVPLTEGFAEWGYDKIHDGELEIDIKEKSDAGGWKATGEKKKIDVVLMGVHPHASMLAGEMMALMGGLSVKYGDSAFKPIHKHPVTDEATGTTKLVPCFVFDKTKFDNASASIWEDAALNDPQFAGVPTAVLDHISHLGVNYHGVVKLTAHSGSTSLSVKPGDDIYVAVGKTHISAFGPQGELLDGYPVPVGKFDDQHGSKPQMVRQLFAKWIGFKGLDGEPWEKYAEVLHFGSLKVPEIPQEVIAPAHNEHWIPTQAVINSGKLSFFKATSGNGAGAIYGVPLSKEPWYGFVVADADGKPSALYDGGGNQLAKGVKDVLAYNNWTSMGHIIESAGANVKQAMYEKPPKKAAKTATAAGYPATGVYSTDVDPGEFYDRVNTDLTGIHMEGDHGFTFGASGLLGGYGRALRIEKLDKSVVTRVNLKLGAHLHAKLLKGVRYQPGTEETTIGGTTAFHYDASKDMCVEIKKGAAHPMYAGSSSTSPYSRALTQGSITVDGHKVGFRIFSSPSDTSVSFDFPEGASWSVREAAQKALYGLANYNDKTPEVSLEQCDVLEQHDEDDQRKYLIVRKLANGKFSAGGQNGVKVSMHDIKAGLAGAVTWESVEEWSSSVLGAKQLAKCPLRHVMTNGCPTTYFDVSKLKDTTETFVKTGIGTYGTAGGVSRILSVLKNGVQGGRERSQTYGATYQNGSSQSSDIGTGDADAAYLRPMKGSGGPYKSVCGGNMLVYLDPKVLGDPNLFGTPNDNFGNVSSQSSWTNGKTVGNLFKNAKTAASTEYLCHNVPPSAIMGIAVPSGKKAEVVAALQEQGMDEVNGVPVEQFIIEAGQMGGSAYSGGDSVYGKLLSHFKAHYHEANPA